MRQVVFTLLCAALTACGTGVDKSGGGPLRVDSGSTSGDMDTGLSPTGDAGTTQGDDASQSGLMGVDAMQPDTAQPTQTYIYAHTDTELYSMDPMTKAVTDIGPFAGNTGSITDLAVDANGELWVNSTTQVYTAALPASGKGTVQLTLKTTLPTGSKFYALGFVPAGVLATGETLIAGDGAGDLYFIDTSGPSTTPRKLGSFGPWQAGDPAPGQSGDFWALSGDVVFYMDGTTPRGIATLRDCYQSSSSTTPTCNNTNDVLAEIDMNALENAFKSGTPATSLRKQILGGGTQHGRLFGIGAWGANVYAFSRVDTKNNEPAKLLQIGSAGTATELQSFASITAGWSGAGVTTKATVTVLPPPM